MRILYPGNHFTNEHFDAGRKGKS